MSNFFLIFTDNQGKIFLILPIILGAHHTWSPMGVAHHTQKVREKNQLHFISRPRGQFAMANLNFAAKNLNFSAANLNLPCDKFYLP